jgi:hypothetical protein
MALWQVETAIILYLPFKKSKRLFLRILPFLPTEEANSDSFSEMLYFAT